MSFDPSHLPMSDTVIQVENLSKKYLLGGKGHPEGLRHVVEQITTAPWRWLRRRSQPAAHRNGVSNGVSKSLPEFWALNDVSFEVGRGEVIGIIGRNGAGKSTLLKILSRITEQTRGRVEITGRVASLLEVGTGFHPELTGRENIFLNGAILGMNRREIRRKFDEIVAFAEVERFLDTPVKRYSSGMYVRLAFAVAAHLEPEILIVDEVLAVGDAQFQKKCLGKMQDVARGGRTVLFVSHNMGTVTSLCSRALWLAGGQLHRTGSVREVVNDYLTKGLASNYQIVNLRDLSRPSFVHDSRLRLESIEWLTDVPLQHGEPAEALLRFTTNSPVDGVSLGIGFSTIEGTRLLTYDTDFQADPRPDLTESQTRCVRLTIDSLPLGPAIYALDVGSRSGDLHPLDYLPAVAQIEVIPGPKTPGSIVRQDAGVRCECSCAWLEK
jgi:lipopolysaccharide transport system ATP-binding protein